MAQRNKRIVTYRNLARKAAESNFRLAEKEPFRSFVQDSVPGEPILVTRMIYEVIKRLNIESKIDKSRMIYFGRQKFGGYDVEFLDELLKGKSKKKMNPIVTKELMSKMQTIRLKTPNIYQHGCKFMNITQNWSNC